MNATADLPAISAEDRLRADLYNYLGLMLAGPPDQMLLDQTAALTGDDSELGQAIATLARVAKVSKPKAVEIGQGRTAALCELLSYRVSERKAACGAAPRYGGARRDARRKRV